MVPGLPEDQYTFTLLLSMAGGLVAGAVTRLETSGKVMHATASATVVMYNDAWACDVNL